MRWIDKDGNQDVVPFRTIDDIRLMTEWEYQWHDLINDLVNGKSIEDYFKTLK